MSMTLALVLDDETADYLQSLAAGQGRTAAELAAHLVTDEVRRERAIDAELVARLDQQAAEVGQRAAGPQGEMARAARSERVGA